MSLESKIEALTAAVIALTTKMESGTVSAPAPVAPAPAPVVQAAPAPVAAPAMPAPPAFVNPAPYVPMDAPVVTGAPFADPKGLIDYVMTSYKALGATKGAQIQGVLVSLGYQNINDVKPEDYRLLFTGIEALK